MHHRAEADADADLNQRSAIPGGPFGPTFACLNVTASARTVTVAPNLRTNMTTSGATAPAVAFHRGSSRLFSVLIPEESLREGANTVQLFSIEGNRRAPALRPLG